MNSPPDDPQQVTTALSTLSARIAVLERWLHRLQRKQTVVEIVILIAFIVLVVLLSTR
jgi:hypothetical protein